MWLGASRPRIARANDLQMENVLEMVEVPIAVEQGVLVFEAERGDEAIDCLPDRPSAGPQDTIVARRRLGEGHAPRIEDLEAPEMAKDSRGGPIGRKALKNLTHRQVEQTEALA